MGTTFLSHTTPPGILVCNMVVFATSVSVVLTAASSNAPRRTIPWTVRPAKNTVNGKSGEPLSATKRPRTVDHPVSMGKATPSLSENGTNLCVVPQLSHTIQLKNTHATVLPLVITAVAAVTAIQVLVSASVSSVSQVPLVRRSLTLSKFIFLILNTKFDKPY